MTGRRAAPEVRIRRAYDPPEEADGFRILVDRLWPRGLRRDGAWIDLWLKEVAPSNGLRQWFGHDPDRWTEFRTRYRAELRGSSALESLLAEVARHRQVTLLFGARDVAHNNAVVLREICARGGRGQTPAAPAVMPPQT
ncbi:hypothetical protein RGI145_14800 [Roseomonas gilardii]|uniref:MarR family transcriptional regulator n=1 Tax=Roseomonas gilardii TaxID=257708 RepID=A0A1L7AHB2_9PROT|nr:DUF488 domain-containing protein [Roseomonas gilardii]APT58188.1 hypothetical protein RGI145_14800 [Roseomonas gilardii]